MTSQSKISKTSWLIGILTIPIELCLSIPAITWAYSIGILTYNFSRMGFWDFQSYAYVLGALGVIALAVLLPGLFRARKLGEIPAHRGLTVLFAVAIAIASLQTLLLVRALNWH